MLIDTKHESMNMDLAFFDVNPLQYPQPVNTLPTPDKAVLMVIVSFWFHALITKMKTLFTSEQNGSFHANSTHFETSPSQIFMKLAEDIGSIEKLTHTNFQLSKPNTF